MTVLKPAIWAVCLTIFTSISGSHAISAKMLACTKEYRPVCARQNSGRIKTFANKCMARAAGARIIYRKKCRIHKPAPVACIALYDPVCAKIRHRKYRTFSNSCHAARAGAVVVHKGKCR